MKVLCILVSLVVVIKADYHEEIGIPLAARIKAAEEELFAKGPENSVKYRVAGGELVDLGVHPYVAALVITLKDGRHSMCAGALLSNHHLVTIAQCVKGASSIEVVLGSLYVYMGGTRIRTTEFEMHPSFNNSHSLDYDIAKIKLPRNVELTSTINVVLLPSTPEELETIGEWGVAAGWGLTSDSVYFWSTNTQLSHVRLKLIPEQKCKDSYQVSLQPYNNICTSGNGAVGMCRGDAGAPLVLTKGGLTILTGISSYGPTKCEDGHPDAFTRIATYVEFIKRYKIGWDDVGN